MTSTTRTMLIVAAVLASTVASYGCQKTPADTNSAGTEPHLQPDHEMNEARNQADPKTTGAQQDVITAKEEADKTAAQAQMNANDKIREENRAVKDTHDETRSWAQEKVDDVDHLIDAATTKAQTATPKAKAKFNDSIEVVKRDRDALRADMATLDTHTGGKLDKSKEQFTGRIDRIKAKIENIEKAL